MKMKNANFFHLHIEKVIIGVALLVAGGVVLLYVLGNPYTGTVDNQRLTSSQLQERASTAANQLNVALNSTESGVPERTIPPYTQEFRFRAENRIAPSRPLPTIARTGLSPADFDIGTDIDPWRVPFPPVPRDAVAQAGVGVLGEFEDREVGERIIQLVGDHQPRDFRYVSVKSTFDLGEWQDRLSESRMPSQFYRAIVNIAGVYLLREELRPGGNPDNEADWINRTTVRPLPSQIAFLPTFRHEFTQEDADYAIGLIKDNQDRIARPAFVPLGPTATMWQAPGTRQLSAEDHASIHRIREQMTRVERRIRNFERQMERQGGAQRPTPTRPQANDFDPFGGGAGPGRQPAQQPPAAGGDRRLQEQQRAYQRDLEELQRLQMEFEQIAGTPADIDVGSARRFDPDFDVYGPGMGGPGRGFDPTGEMADMYSDGPTRRFGRPAGPQQPTEPEAPREITVWAHDLTVEPGKVYRYRVLVSVINPLFRQRRAPEQQVQENFHKLALGPDKSEGGEVEQAPWSAPVRVEPERHFFVVGGSQQNARVEVWRVFNGMFINQVFTVQPGDPIGQPYRMTINGAQQEIDMTYPAVVVDLVESAGGIGARDSRLLYLEPDTGRLASRSATQDTNHPERLRLQNQQMFQEQAAASTAAAAQR
jgi:hypothetical protein